MKVHLLGTYAIPVGHQVAVAWYRIVGENGGFFSSPTLHELHIPIVRDLDTGIRYAHRKHMAVSRLSWSIGKINIEEHQLHPSLQLVKQVRGRVCACSIVYVNAEQMETELMLDDIEEQSDEPA